MFQKGMKGVPLNLHVLGCHGAPRVPTPLEPLKRAAELWGAEDTESGIWDQRKQTATPRVSRVRRRLRCWWGHRKSKYHDKIEETS